MDPRFLLIQQIKVNAEQIEQYLQYVYSEQYTQEQRQIALRYLYILTRQISELTSGLFRQYRRIEGTL